MDDEIDITKPYSGKNVDKGFFKPINIALIVFGILLLAGVGFVALKMTGNFGGNDGKSGAKLVSYRTNGKLDLKEGKSMSAPVRAVLREGTILSGKIAGSVDGIDWVEVTSVDGAHGFLPLSGLEKIGESADLSQVKESNRRIVTSALINLRAAPSLSSAIIGTVDGGTRLSSDGYVSSQGEDWLRVRIGRDTTGFVMARFTTPDDDRGASEGFASSKIGVPGTIKAITNVQATPFPDARVIRSLLEGDGVGVLGQTRTDDWWYIVRLDDGTQGFVPKNSVLVSQKEGKWVYPDGSEAPAPNVPQAKKPVGEKKSGNANGGADDPSRLPTAQNPLTVEFNKSEEVVETPTSPSQPDTPATPN